MVFKVGQEWFSSAKPWTTLMNDLICLNCDMDDLPRCFTSAAFNRRNDGTLFSKSVPYLIGPANRRQNLYATQQQSPKTSLYTTIFHFYKYDSTRQSSCFCKLVRPVWRNRLFRSFEWVCCNYRPTTMSMENSTPDDDIVHAACLHHLLASGDWEWERENSITVDTSLPHESIQYRTIERGGRDARKIEAEEPTIIILWIMYNIDSFIAFIVHLHAPWRKNGRQSRRK